MRIWFTFCSHTSSPNRTWSAFESGDFTFNVPPVTFRYVSRLFASSLAILKTFMPNSSGYSGASVYRSNPCKNVSTPAFRSAEPKKHGNIFRCTIISLICSPAILPVSKKLSIAVSSSMAISSIIVLLFSFSCASSSVPAPSSVKSMHPSDNCFFNSKRIAALSVPG